MQHASELYFGQTAAEYDEVRTKSKIWIKEDKKIIPALSARIKQGDRVIDLAAGTGRWMDLCFKLGAEITLIDISSDMLKEAERKAQAVGKSVDMIVSDARLVESLPKGDWLISTRFYNWVKFAALKSAVKAAHKSGIPNIGISVRVYDMNATWRQWWETFKVWQIKNIESRRGTRKKGIFYMQSHKRINALFREYGYTEISDFPIAKGRGEVYTFIIASRPNVDAKSAPTP